MTAIRAVPHPSESGLPALKPTDLADPALWAPKPVQIIDAATSHLGLRYAIAPGWRPLTLDLHLPLRSNGPTPVVVYAHGGGFSGGIKEMGPWSKLPSQGIAVATIDYRLTGEVCYPEPIEDVLAAIRWIRANAETYNLRSDQIAGWGSSAGGYLMARAALCDDISPGRPIGDHVNHTARLSAVVLHYPVTDFATLVGDTIQPTASAHNDAIDVISRFFGAPMSASEDILAGASVPSAARRASHLPPTHLSHGDADQRCGLRQSTRLHETILAEGGSSLMNIVAGANHADPVFSTPPVVESAVKFLHSVWEQNTPISSTTPSPSKDRPGQ
ncbi:alpha/beta hydrolase [Rhodococcus jostii]|uniref:alpha/beta hydrolase n=1 Tax=Rhodococcus jostii TaxID=132919 RepID=UPI0019682B09|nr:alpha/beta hydrolase [Rhodococcus jostii]